MVKASQAERKIERASHTKWVAISTLVVSEEAQRKFKPDYAMELVAKFELEKMGLIVVNRREGQNFVVDGQHRVAALKELGFEDDMVECEYYEGLTLAGEADLFLGRDDRKAIVPFDKFRIALVAQRDPETSINRVVEKEGLKVSQAGSNKNSIQAVGSLMAAYEAVGAAGLGRTLRILRDSFDGEPRAFTAPLIRGTALVVGRYGAQLNDDQVVNRLSSLRQGAMGLVKNADVWRIRTDRGMADSVAAAIVESYNKGKAGPNRLERWFS